MHKEVILYEKSAWLSRKTGPIQACCEPELASQCEIEMDPEFSINLTWEFKFFLP
jgi:hypothetical protein